MTAENPLRRLVEDAREDVTDLVQTFARLLEPFPKCAVSEFAERYRRLMPGTTEKPGPWSNDVFPFLVPVMDGMQWALENGKRGVVLMKAAQLGGSEAVANFVYWCMRYYPGPMMYMISKDEHAREFGRERFDLEACCTALEGLVRSGRGAGKLVHVKRLVNGKLAILGGRSVLNLQSFPYRIVVIDELDSLMAEVGGEGDPVALAQERTGSFQGLTLVVAFAHPTVPDRGAGKLYYDLSDQRRAFAPCPHCGEFFWLQWKHVQVVPADGLTKDQAAQDPEYYRYITPCCEKDLSDAQRYAMARRTEQRSTLAEGMAARKQWVGMHFSQLYMSNKPLRDLASEWIAAQGDEGRMRPFYNKKLGDVYVPKIKETTADDWRRCIAIPRFEGDPHAHLRGQVPMAVQYLTAGQDSKSDALHWVVWGWGFVRDVKGIAHFCGWLIDYGEFKREKSATLTADDLAVLDQVLYQKGWLSVDGSVVHYIEQAGHDSGWQEIAAYDYCQRHLPVAVPIKGGAEDSESVQPFLRWTGSPRWRVAGEEVTDPNMRLCVLNTYKLKEDWYGLAKKSFEVADGVKMGKALTRRHAVLTLPADTTEELLTHFGNEELAPRPKKKGTYYRRKGDQHLLDSSIYARALALNHRLVQLELPLEEARRNEEKATQEQKRRERDAADGERPWLASDGQGGDWIRER